MPESKHANVTDVSPIEAAAYVAELIKSVAPVAPAHKLRRYRAALEILEQVSAGGHPTEEQALTHAMLVEECATLRTRMQALTMAVDLFLRRSLSLTELETHNRRALEVLK